MFDRPTISVPAVLTALCLGLLAGCSASSTSAPPGPQAFLGPTAATTGTLSAGAAVVPIALPNGVALAGFGGSARRQMDGAILLTGGPLFGMCLDPDPTTAAVFFKPSTGALDPLSARALVLDNGTRRMAIVKVDAIGMSRKLRDEINTLAMGPYSVTDGLFTMVATHTHSGPGGVSNQAGWEITASDCFSQPVYDAVRDAAATALKNAVAGLQPAELGMETTFVNGATEIRDHSSAAAPAPDIEIGLVKVVASGLTPQPIAALFNFAVHGTWYGDGNMKTSADYMGEIEKQVQSALPGVVAIFTNGAEGDVKPTKAFPTQTIDQAAKPVADAVIALWTSPILNSKMSSTVTLNGVFTEAKMPKLRYNPGCMPLAGTTGSVCDLTGGQPPAVPMPTNWVSKKLPFQALRINDAVFIAMPGEPVTQLGFTMKEQAANAGLKGFVVSLANDHGGYFTTTAQFDAGTYEGKATLYGRNTGAKVLQQSALVISKVQ